MTFKLLVSRNTNRLTWWLSSKESTSNEEAWVLSLCEEDSLGGKDPLEKEMVTHPSILAWEILWTEEPRGATVHGITRVRHRD